MRTGRTTKFAACTIAIALFGASAGVYGQQDQQQQRSAKGPLTPQQRNLLSQLSDAIHATAESVENSVVHIETTSVSESPLRRQMPGGQELPEDLREQLRRFFGDQMPQQPREQVRRGLGSGIVFDRQGHILTNNHVVAEAERIRVLSTDGRPYIAEVVGSDPLTDVAVIKITGKSVDLPPARFGDSSKVRVGDLVLAVGNPFGLDYSVTMGIISAMGRSGLQLGSIYYQDFLQTDAAINPGNSGGPLVNMEGEVIGLNTAIATQTGQYAGVGFAIPSDLATRIARVLIEKGEVTRGWLGVSIEELTPGLAQSFDFPAERTGVLVQDVVPNSPAAKAGFKSGDIIMAVDGSEVRTPSQLQTIVTLTPPGQEVTFSVWRDGEEMELTATLEQLKREYLRGMGENGAPGEPGTPSEYQSEELGMTAVTPTAAVAEKFGWTETPKGALVTEVEGAGEAASLGIRPGDVIVRVQNQPIESARDLRQAMGEVSLADGFRMYIRNPRAGGRYVYVQRG